MTAMRLRMFDSIDPDSRTLLFSLVKDGPTVTPANVMPELESAVKRWLTEGFTLWGHGDDDTEPLDVVPQDEQFLPLLGTYLTRQFRFYAEISELATEWWAHAELVCIAVPPKWERAMVTTEADAGRQIHA